ncbi:threonine ammonia-lyase [Pacificispira sp.]|uniref:threonine ammonia-lyase n=1 Tax=Pacificispira sp. TaxID=2888761 RepID=UPI003BAD06E7
MTEVTYDAVLAAHRRLSGRIVETPLIENARINELAGRRVLLKLETLQHTGSFKYRGAMNALLALPEHVRAAGVVAYSSGNHGKALAAAARQLSVSATVIMPADAPANKVDAVKSCGARVVLYDRDKDDREAIAGALIAETGATLIPPFDHPHIIAGQGTSALEAADELDRRNDAVERVFVPCSGGGLAAGYSLVLAERMSSTVLTVVEPAAFDDTGRSLASGRIVANDRRGGSICDALLVTQPGRLTFRLLQQAGANGVTVTDEQVRAAIRLAAIELKVVLEPGGAAGLAAALLSEPFGDGPALVVASGGNIDPDLLSDALSGPKLGGEQL